MELLPVFLVTLLVVVALVLALAFGRAPTYRPTREQIIALLEGVLDGTTDHVRWDLFIGMAIQHDEILEAARVQCVILHEGLDGQIPARPGLDGFIYDREGRERIKEILDELKQIIREAPIDVEF